MLLCSLQNPNCCGDYRFLSIIKLTESKAGVEKERHFPLGGTCFKTALLILSLPGAFLFFKLLIMHFKVSTVDAIVLAYK